ncbi:MAG TPA: DNA replication/repair protein RecF [Streptosporangiaceae bacterium]|nr:DNA replication/repair protein RecF [Streptosporangiaceae bacterium]
MYVSRIALTDFRSYPAVDLSLGPGVTGFIGPNGHGKTNLVEALAYAATLGSHRTATDAPLVRRGAERAIVRVQIDSATARTLVELEINPGRANRARLNKAAVRQPRHIIGALRTVLFAPEDLALVKGDPGERRRFLDDLLVARSPRFAAVRADYERVVKQRSALLKSAGIRGMIRSGQAGQGRHRGQSAASGQAASTGMLASLDTWDDHLAQAGAELVAGRLELVERLRPLVTAAYAQLADDQADARIRYRPSFPIDGVNDADEDGRNGGGTGGVASDASGSGRGGVARGSDGPSDGSGLSRGRAPSDGSGLSRGGAPSGGRATQNPAGGGSAPGRKILATALLDALARSRPAELDRGVCLTGPHRDELELSIGELPARGYASHGESWSLALALRLASYELLRADGEDPVLLLDDVFAELDPGRRERLAELAVTAEQALVTAAAAADVPTALAGVRFTIRDGVVERAQ